MRWEGGSSKGLGEEGSSKTLVVLALLRQHLRPGAAAAERRRRREV